MAFKKGDKVVCIVGCYAKTRSGDATRLREGDVLTVLGYPNAGSNLVELAELIGGYFDTRFKLYQPDPNVFWMVYVDGGSAPQGRYDNHQSAVDEAKRLALLSDGKMRRVYILETVDVVESEPVKIRHTKL